MIDGLLRAGDVLLAYGELLLEPLLHPRSGTRTAGGRLVALAGVLSVLAVSILLVRPPRAAGDVLSDARSLSQSGQYDEAIARLRDHLARKPDDVEARVLLGTVYSWAGRYDEARAELERVIASHPDHAEARLAQIRVELWSKHPERAADLAGQALSMNPADPDLLLLRADALQQSGEAKASAEARERLLAIAPDSDAAKQLRAREAAPPLVLPWVATVGYQLDWFDDGRSIWHEVTTTLQRATPVGPVLVRWSNAQRFGIDDNQIELEGYPLIRRGTYGYLTGGYSPQAKLYPHFRAGGDIYQALPKAFEMGAGYRRLQFNNKVDIYSAYFGKYYGNWLFSGRVFVVHQPGHVSEPIDIAVRRYFGDGTEYVGAHYGHGPAGERQTRTDFTVLQSNSTRLELQKSLSQRLALYLTTGYAREDRVVSGKVNHLLVGMSLSYRF